MPPICICPLVCKRQNQSSIKTFRIHHESRTISSSVNLVKILLRFSASFWDFGLNLCEFLAGEICEISAISPAKNSLRFLQRSQSKFCRGYKTDRFHVAVHLLEIDQRRHQNVVRTSATHSPDGSCATFLFPHFDVICAVIYNIILLNRCTAKWNLFVK